jgi:hypothetical protein
MNNVLSQMNRMEIGTVWFHLYQRVIPLLDERFNPHGPIVGCGMLLRLTTGTYFITAAHVIDSVKGALDHVGIPYGPYHTRTTTLGRGIIRNTNKTATADIDFSVLPLSDEATRVLSWECVTADDLIALRPAETMNEFILFGYPNWSAKAFERDDGALDVNAFPVFLRTGRFIGDSSISQPQHPEVDLFLAYGDKARDKDGKEVAAPSLPGISGSPI